METSSAFLRFPKGLVFLKEGLAKYNLMLRDYLYCRRSVQYVPACYEETNEKIMLAIFINKQEMMFQILFEKNYYTHDVAILRMNTSYVHTT